MINNEQADKSPLFMSPDDKHDDELEYLTPPAPRPSEKTKQQEPRPQTNTLFFADSEDEEITALRDMVSTMNDIPGMTLDIGQLGEEMNVDVQTPRVESGRASSVSSVSSAAPPISSSPACSIPPETSNEPPKKKRKLSPEASDPFVSAYLGSFLVGNAWSTVRGKGFVKV